MAPVGSRSSSSRDLYVYYGTFRSHVLLLAARGLRARFDLCPAALRRPLRPVGSIPGEKLHGHVCKLIARK